LILFALNQRLPHSLFMTNTKKKLSPAQTKVLARIAAGLDSETRNSLPTYCKLEALGLIVQNRETFRFELTAAAQG
jgi:hypothetical protein